MTLWNLTSLTDHSVNKSKLELHFILKPGLETFVQITKKYTKIMQRINYNHNSKTPYIRIYMQTDII